MIGPELTLLRLELEGPLARFFRVLAAEEGLKFHPHPLTSEEAGNLCRYSGEDLYYVLVQNDLVLGYGILRGWDAGYEFPSVGIALHPEVRRLGWSRVLMNFLHAVAKRKGSKKIRLKVYPNNNSAIGLYKDLGYVFEEEEKGQLVGWLNLVE